MIYTWWKGTQLSKFFSISEEECFQHGKDLIEGGIRQNISVKSQIRTYLLFLNNLKRRKDNNQPIYQSDHRLGFHSLMALCYLQIVNIDDGDTGVFFAPLRRGPRVLGLRERK